MNENAVENVTDDPDVLMPVPVKLDPVQVGAPEFGVANRFLSVGSQAVQILPMAPKRSRALIRCTAAGGQSAVQRSTYNVGDPADKLILSGISGKVTGIIVYNNDTIAHGLNLYDPTVNGSSNATLNLLAVGPAPGAAAIGSTFFSQPIAFSNGLLLNLTGAVTTNPVYVIVEYTTGGAKAIVGAAGQVGNGASGVALSGFQLGQGEELAYGAQQPLFVVCDTPGQTVDVSVLDERYR